MIIMHQEKHSLYNFDKIQSLYIRNESILEAGINHFAIYVVFEKDHRCWIAKYNTEERAKQVLEELANNFIMGHKVFIMPPKEEKQWKKENY